MNHWDDSIDDVDIPCPKCGEYAVRSKDCDEWNCDDGYCDEHEDDPINFAPGEEYTICRGRWGTGFQVWCSKCGHGYYGGGV